MTLLPPCPAWQCAVPCCTARAAWAAPRCGRLPPQQQQRPPARWCPGAEKTPAPQGAGVSGSTGAAAPPRAANAARPGLQTGAARPSHTQRGGGAGPRSPALAAAGPAHGCAAGAAGRAPGSRPPAGPGRAHCAALHAPATGLPTLHWEPAETRGWPMRLRPAGQETTAQRCVRRAPPRRPAPRGAAGAPHRAVRPAPAPGPRRAAGRACAKATSGWQARAAPRKNAVRCCCSKGGTPVRWKSQTSQKLE